VTESALIAALRALAPDARARVIAAAQAETALRVAEGTHPLLPTGVVQCGPEVPHPVGCACRWCSPPRAPR